MNKYDVVFFDVDGTLLDSNTVHAEAWSRACKRYDFERLPSFFQPFIGMGGESIFPKIDPSLNAEAGVGKMIADERKRLILEEYAQHLKPFPHARELVRCCKDQGMRTYIATSASQKELERFIEILQISDLIDDVVTASDAKRAKPAPDIVEAALKKSQVTADRAVLIGDTIYDITAAKQAGVPTIAMRCGGSSDDALREAIAIYNDPADMIAHSAEIFTS